MTEWTSRSDFLSEDGMLRCQVLNQITFLINHDHLGILAWNALTKLAEETDEEDANGMRVSLVISTYELFVEDLYDGENMSEAFMERYWLDQEPGLRRLFSLESNPKARWAVFMAHDLWPERFEENIRMFSGGGIDQDEYLNWMAQPRDPRPSIVDDF